MLEPNTRFKEEGEYSADIILSPEDPGVEDFIETLRGLAQAKFDEVQGTLSGRKAQDLRIHLPFDDEVDRESGEPTGNYVVKFRKKASGKNRDGEVWRSKLPVYNADGTPYEGLEPWGGSVIQVSAEPNAWYMNATGKAGVSLKLKAVRLLEVRTGGGGNSAEDFGFEVSAPVEASVSNEEQYPF